ncbi:MAG: hypothetical protein FJ083_06610 [Cyanobacteria bacterium K_Offshore_surface_m2_239]|nr:hypothetical protein [Cyanobacteria bacterium K_Offshore_surface_m2_239]
MVLAKAAWFGRLLGASQSLPNWSILGLCVLFALLGAGVAVLALKRTIDHLKAGLIREKEQASRDPLTRLYNQGNVKTVLKQRLAAEELCLPAEARAFWLLRFKKTRPGITL